MPAFAARTIALLCAGLLLAALSHYPLAGTPLLPLLAGYCCCLLWKPERWLLLLPLLLPVADFAPWTGWFFLDEVDLLLLITASCSYWKLAGAPCPALRLAPGTGPALSLLAVAAAIGLLRGLQPWSAPDANAFNNYLSPYNALRIGKAGIWLLILQAPLRQAAGARLEGIATRFIPGMLGGLALVTLAAIAERASFPGLLNFSADYRSTAPFSAMHTGGAALDGYLALSIPLIGCYLAHRQTLWRSGAALVLLCAALYAGLSTFSRGLYGALLASMLVLALLHGGARPALRRRTLLAGLLAVALAGLLAAVFHASGYRGMAAALGLLLAGAALAGAPASPAAWGRAALWALAIELPLALMLPASEHLHIGWLKPPYLLFSAALLLFGWALLPMLNSGPAALRMTLALPAFLALMCNTLWIAWHWGGAGALPASAAALLAATLMPVLARRGPSAFWRPDRATLTLGTGMAAVLALAIPIVASYYASERLAGSLNDGRLRLRHWQEVLAIMDDDPATTAFGMGLGTFPRTYFWRNTMGETPPTLDYLVDDMAGGERLLRLTAGHYQAGYGEMLRLLQRVPVEAHTAYRIELDARARAGDSFLHLNLCERQLLYPQNCQPLPLRRLAPGLAWQHLSYALDSGTLGARGWLSPPVQLELAVEGRQAVVEIDNLSLRDLEGRELIRNGSFSDGNDYWFFSSDRHHLPWHVKNLLLNLYFELGLAGLLAFLALFGAAAVHLLGSARRQASAAPWLAALCGFLLVGLFDSLLDVPRLSLLFFLALCCACLQAAPEPKP